MYFKDKIRNMNSYIILYSNSDRIRETLKPIIEEELFTKLFGDNR